eukprot:12895260-Prorocentrum_lima.AAC.1
MDVAILDGVLRGTEKFHHNILDNLPRGSVHLDVLHCAVRNQGCALVLREFQLNQEELSEQVVVYSVAGVHKSVD